MKRGMTQSFGRNVGRTEAQRTLATDDDGGFTIMEDTSVESYSLPPLQAFPDYAEFEETQTYSPEETQPLSPDAATEAATEAPAAPQTVELRTYSMLKLPRAKRGKAVNQKIYISFSKSGKPTICSPKVF